MPITTNSKSIPLQGDEKTLIQRLRNYIEPVDKGWFNRLQPANEAQIDELKQQLELNKAGIELPLVYTEFLRHAGEGAGGLFLPAFCAEMSVSSLISCGVKLQINQEERNAPYYFTFLRDNLAIGYTMDLDHQFPKISLEEEYPVSANFENFVMQSAVKCYESKYYTQRIDFSASINALSNSETGKKGLDLFEFVNDALEMYHLQKAWFNDEYFYFAYSNKWSIFLDRSVGGFWGSVFLDELQIGKDIGRVLSSKAGAHIYINGNTNPTALQGD